MEEEPWYKGNRQTAFSQGDLTLAQLSKTFLLSHPEESTFFVLFSVSKIFNVNQISICSHENNVCQH